MRLSPPDAPIKLFNDPTGSHAQKPSDQPVKNPLIVANLTKLDLRVSELQYLPIYDVHMMGGLRKWVSGCYEDVRSHRYSTLEFYEKEENYLDDIFSDVNFVTNCEEEEMVESGAHSSNDRYYSADIEGIFQKHMLS